GCTDPVAHNYNPAATVDDGSCETCSDGIQNGDETGVDCGGSLCGPCLIPGCTDPVAHNYNPAATVDDGSCETCSDGIQNGDETGVDCGGSLCGPCPIPGCTDPVAHNYNPAATVDDGSCETCSDGIQNGDETGIDCGGNLCGPCGCSDLVNTVFPELPDILEACTTDDPILLPNVDANGVTGSWNINTPILPGDLLGTYDLTFSPDPEQCATAFSLTLEVAAPVMQEFELADTICATVLTLMLPTNSLSGTPGSWFMNGDPIESLISLNYIGQVLDLSFVPEEGYCALTTDWSLYVSDCSQNDSYTLSGEVYTWTDYSLPDVQLRVDEDTVVTNMAGRYSSGGHQVGDSIFIEPLAHIGNVSTSAGLNLLDLVLVQQHLLGLSETPLSNYQVLAADVNADGTINVLDLVMMRRILLGIDESFGPLPDWIFINADYQFPDGEELVPLIWPYSVTVNPVVSNSDNYDFIAIKRGDLDGSYPDN
ncbi:MAG: dockerin type I domain-containing protein, partial [Bacteroidota bacterium]